MLRGGDACLGAIGPGLCGYQKSLDWATFRYFDLGTAFGTLLGTETAPPSIQRVASRKRGFSGRWGYTIRACTPTETDPGFPIEAPALSCARPRPGGGRGGRAPLPRRIVPAMGGWHEKGPG